MQFRYGQCNQAVCVGPIRCRVVTCVPPWQWDPACSTRPVLTNEMTRNHDRPCLHDWFTDIPPQAFYAPAVRWMSDRGIATGLTEDLFAPDEPIRWEHFATLLWSYAAGAREEPLSPLDEAVPRTDYERAVDWLISHGIPAGHRRYLDPANEVTRADAITFLHRLAAFYPPGTGADSSRTDLYPERNVFADRQPFPDVPERAWYADSLDWAVGHAIVWWSPPEPFHPDRSVTRSEAAVYLHRFHNPPEPPAETEPGSAQPWR